MTTDGVGLPPFTVAVLTGGRSSRMGRDKVFLPVAGGVLADRAREAATVAGAVAVLAIGGDPVALGALGYEPVADVHPGEGPLGAILTALAAAPTDVVVVLAVDLPNVTASGLLAMVDVLADHDAALARGDHREPLHAVYRRRLRPHLAAVFAAGERAVHRAIVGLDVVELRLPDARLLVNLNTPADAAELAGAALASVPTMSIPEISVDDLAGRLGGGAVLFDVRRPDEFDEAHVAGARLVPLDQVPARVDEFHVDGEIYVICRSGGRSRMACDFLLAHGITATNVAGGTLAWIATGRDIVSGTGIS